MKAGTLKRAIVALVPGPAAGRQVGAVQALQGQGPRATPRSRRWRANIIARRRRAQERRQVPEAGHRPAERRRGAAIHRRHHRHAQGRHAHPRQRLHQLQQVAAWATDLEDGQGARAGGAAVLPRVRHDRGDELRRRQGRRDRHHAALRARRRHEAHRQDASRR